MESTAESFIQPKPGRDIFDLPVELTLKILTLLPNFQDAFNFAASAKTLHGIFTAHTETLALSILARELSPLDPLLQTLVAAPSDLDAPWGPCLRRRIYHNGKLVSSPPAAGEEEPGRLLPPATLDAAHFRALLRAYRTVRDWEQYFPSYRFRDAPEDCRALRPHEARRLRGALYVWMGYAKYFHGDWQRSGRCAPDVVGAGDVRCARLRMLSDAELCVLDDLWRTAVSMVRGHICPSTELVMKENVSFSTYDGSDESKMADPVYTKDHDITLDEAENLSFGSSGVNAAIVDTFLKLSPADILRYASNRFAHSSRHTLVREVALKYGFSILQDQQSLGNALWTVFEERKTSATMLAGYTSHSRHTCSVLTSQGGVLDLQEGAPGWLRDPRESNGEKVWDLGEEERSQRERRRGQRGYEVVESRLGRLEP